MNHLKKPTTKEVEKYAKALGSRMRAIREELGLTRKAVAKRVGVSDSTLQRWEYGISQVSVKDFLRLAKVYHVKAEDFFSGIKFRSPVTARHDNDFTG